VGTELFNADGRTDGRKDRQTDRQTDRHGEANSRFSHFCERAWKLSQYYECSVQLVEDSFMTTNSYILNVLRLCTLSKLEDTA
jgi:hypothetical protein